MAILDGNMFGTFSGKYGLGVGSKWKGRATLRTYVRNNHSSSEDQRLIRARFTRLGKLARAFQRCTDLGFEEVADALRMTCGNVFVKNNWFNVTALTPAEVTVNYSSLQVADGLLPAASFGAVDYGTGQHLQVSVTMTGGSDQYGADDNDDVYLFAYCPDLEQGALSQAAKRSADKVQVNVPSSWDGMTVHLYAFAIGRKAGLNEGKRSASSYCGSGEIE